MLDTPIVTELVRLHQTTSPKGHFVVQHLHHYYQLDVVRAGSLLTTIEGRRPFLLQVGEVLLIPPLARHAFCTRDRIRHVGFKFHIAPAYWPVFGIKTRRLRLPVRLMEEVNDWGAQFARRSPLYRQLGIAVVTLCLIEIARAFPERATPAGLDSFRGQLWKVLEEIDSAPYAKWSIPQLAMRAHLSRPHFSRRFQKITGRTPKRYLLEVRLRAAAAELSGQSPRPIKEIGEAAGYATVHAFTLAFKRLFGVSPGAYRRHPVKL